ncbi:MAG: alcohol dehydrogenase catalytic domain-containing protein [Bacteroidota bacterium]
MKAIYYQKYGRLDVLEYGELEKAKIQEDEVLVEIHTAALNPIDCEIRKGGMKIVTGNKFPRIPGSDFSGVIVEKGKRTTNFNIGDEVYGMSKTYKGGAYAEYIAVCCPFPFFYDYS